MKVVPNKKDRKMKKKPNNRKKREVTCAYFLFFVMLAIIAGSLLGGCSPRIVERIVETEKVEYRDSVSWRDTTIYVPVPLEAGQAIVHVGDTARRETSVAKAEAWLDTLGLLNLSLENKKTALPYQAKIPSRTIWTSATNTKAEILTKYVPVEKSLTWWQSFRLRAFLPLLLTCLALLIYILRKPILKLLTK